MAGPRLEPRQAKYSISGKLILFCLEGLGGEATSFAIELGFRSEKQRGKPLGGAGNLDELARLLS